MSSQLLLLQALLQSSVKQQLDAIEKQYVSAIEKQAHRCEELLHAQVQPAGPTHGCSALPPSPMYAISIRCQPSCS